jgi:hypothetical protein
MKLADLRKVTIKTNSRIRFSLSNGMECVLNEHGIAQVPAMRAAGDFNLEEELGRAAQFTLEPVPQAKEKARPQVLSREQMAALAGPKSAEAHDEHEE